MELYLRKTSPTNPNPKHKHITNANHCKTSSPCKARENKQTVSNAGKHAALAKRGKTSKRCQTRKNMQPLQSAGKQASGTKRGKHAVGAKRG